MISMGNASEADPARKQQKIAAVYWSATLITAMTLLNATLEGLLSSLDFLYESWARLLSSVMFAVLCSEIAAITTLLLIWPPINLRRAVNLLLSSLIVYFGLFVFQRGASSFMLIPLIPLMVLVGLQYLIFGVLFSNRYSPYDSESAAQNTDVHPTDRSIGNRLSVVDLMVWTGLIGVMLALLSIDDFRLLQFSPRSRVDSFIAAAVTSSCISSMVYGFAIAPLVTSGFYAAMKSDWKGPLVILSLYAGGCCLFTLPFVVDDQRPEAYLLFVYVLTALATMACCGYGLGKFAMKMGFSLTLPVRKESPDLHLPLMTVEQLHPRLKTPSSSDVTRSRESNRTDSWDIE